MQTTEKKWFAVDVRCSATDVEAVEEVLNELDSLGIETNLLAKKPGESIRVTAYFNELPSSDEIDAMLAGIDSIQVATRQIDDTDWLAEWKKHWQATEVGKFVVAPPWETLTSNKVSIKIEPNMAFGTGTHPTTQLCLVAISDEIVSGDSFLDVGCGTGILSIAAAKIGSDGAIVGYDTDENSVAIARENAELNDVAERVRFEAGSIDEQTPRFDFVCANVTLDVIVPILDLLIEKTKRVLVLSGILVEQRDDIEMALREREVENFVVSTSGEWISVLIKVSA